MKSKKRQQEKEEMKAKKEKVFHIALDNNLIEHNLILISISHSCTD